MSRFGWNWLCLLYLLIELLSWLSTFLWWSADLFRSSTSAEEVGIRNWARPSLDDLLLDDLGLMWIRFWAFIWSILDMSMLSEGFCFTKLWFCADVRIVNWSSCCFWIYTPVSLTFSIIDPVLRALTMRRPGCGESSGPDSSSSSSSVMSLLMGFSWIWGFDSGAVSGYSSSSSKIQFMTFFYF